MKYLRLPIVRLLIGFFLLTVLLGYADWQCYEVTLPVEIDRQGINIVLHVDSQTISFKEPDTVATLYFAPRDSVIHEYQIDGTDSTNNFTLDLNYLHNISSSPVYQLYAWMRDLNHLSYWRDLHISSAHYEKTINQPGNGVAFPLPEAPTLHISLQLQRPETPAMLNLITTHGKIIHITLDRNNRDIEISEEVPGQATASPISKTFFPTDPAPFVAMVLDTLIKTMLWAELMLFLILTLEILITCIRRLQQKHIVQIERMQDTDPLPAVSIPAISLPQRITTTIERLTQAIHPLVLLVLGISFLFVEWIAKVQYNGEPHIFDASAYLFAAKMYALGHLSVPVPPARALFPGPFMIQFDGSWFAQYPPGTALTLVPGVWLGVPWLIEPILGTCALLGIGLIAARLYNRQVASLAVLLGSLSPFYSYLAASYLSHAIALFYLVWGLWSFVRFAQGEKGWNLILAAICFGMAMLTRDLVGVLWIVLAVVGALILTRKQQIGNWKRWLVPGGLFITIMLIFLGLELGFNALLTHNPLVSPRTLFFAGDRWGFGPGVGFYGEHTVAAGFVNLDEQLTILAISLYGWPFYFTLAFIAIPFLTRRASITDWLLLFAAVIMTGAFIGYFYHGIYLGPRYLFETLPFLLMLTARGILVLGTVGKQWSEQIINRVVHRQMPGKLHQSLPSIPTVCLLCCLIAYNLFYFMPRQVGLHTNYNSLPTGTALNLTDIYHPPTKIHNAIVVTSDFTLYQFVLFPLNDPLLHDSVIYAMVNEVNGYQQLRQAFPGRTLYQLEVSPTGAVQYIALPPM